MAAVRGESTERWTRGVSKAVRRAAIGFGFLALTGCTKQLPPPEEKPPPAPVKWEPPIRSALEEWTELIGTTAPIPDRVARVTAPIEGRVVAVFGDAGTTPVVEGQRVAKGTPLVRLDDAAVRAAVSKAEATQDVLKEEERQAQIAVDLAASEVERLRQLKAEEDKQPPGTRTLVSPVDRVKADFALKDTQSKLKAAGGRLIAGAKELDALRVQEKLHVLTAPIAGRVGPAKVVRGATLSVGTLVADVLDIDESIDVVCYVPPAVLAKLKLGQPALTGGFDPDPAAPRSAHAEGEVVYIADQAEPDTGNFVVKVRIANGEAKLPANRVLRVRVLTKPGRECLSLRESAVQEDEEFPTVVVITDVEDKKDADGKDVTVGVARRLRVVLGTRDRTLRQVEILSLDDPEKKWAGDVKDALFVVEGGQGLQSGDVVKLDVDVD
jgi:multidrug efflux pump subunit AcrA (membrane-fusion protein)